MNDTAFKKELDRRVEELYDKHKEEMVLAKEEEKGEESKLSSTKLLNLWNEKEQEWQEVAKLMDTVMKKETEKLWDLEKNKNTSV